MSYAGTPDAPFGRPSARPLLILRGVCGLFGVCGMYFSLMYLPLSEATVLTFLAPVLTCYVCSFLMKGEMFTRQQQMAAFVSLGGVVCIARPVTLFRGSSSSLESQEPVEPAPQTSTAIRAANANFTTGTSLHASATPLSRAGPTPHQHLFAIVISLVGGM